MLSSSEPSAPRRSTSQTGRTVHYYVHGRGRGHATRSLEVIRALRQRGERVLVFAGEDAFPVLAEAVDTCRPVPSLPPKPSFSGLTLFVSRIEAALVAARSNPPHVLVSDGDHPAVVAGRTVGAPVIAVGHGLVFSHCVRPPSVSRRAWRREARKAALSSFPANAHVAVSFIPLEPRGRSTVVARPGLDPRLQCPVLVRAPDAPRTVLAYFRDENGDEAISVVRAALHPKDRIIMFGAKPVSGAEIRKRDRADFLGALLHADVVVASAGSQLISECLSLGRPLFALYHPADDEQRLNVEMLAAAGGGQGCPIDPLDREALATFVRTPPSPPPTQWSAPTPAEAVIFCMEQLLE